jgi:hypothetical protein
VSVGVADSRGIIVQVNHIDVLLDSYQLYRVVILNPKCYSVQIRSNLMLDQLGCLLVSEGPFIFRYFDFKWVDFN